MNVSTLSSTSSIFGASQVSGASSTGASGSTPAVSNDVSGIGSLMSQLQQLSQSDPAKFKQVTAEISQQLSTEAGQVSGPQQQFLSQLSDRFAQASQSGTMSPLEPPKQAQGHHHGHGHHAHAAQQSSSPDSVESIIATALQDVSNATATST